MVSVTDRLDLVIFGATGYTGRHVVSELARIAPGYPGLTWAVAGRDCQKLETVIQNVAKKRGVDLSSVKIIVADVCDEESLGNMCGQARVLLNCCGPFMKYGEPVVGAALRHNTHCVDVSGEIQFIDLVQQKYDERARAARICVVSACGLSSVPADLGVLYLQRHFEGTLQSVESYLTTYFPPRMLSAAWKNGIVRYSSWESIINCMAQMSLKDLQQDPLPAMEPELKRRWPIHRALGKWCVVFPCSDGAVVARTQRLLRAQRLRYRPYIAFASILTAIGTIIAGALLFALSKVSCARRLLLECPRLCSFGAVTRGDPPEGAMDDSVFQYEMIGNGWSGDADLKAAPDKSAVARVTVSGVDPAYVGSAVALVYSAIMILKERDRLPSTGGVMTPGVAFKDTSIIQHLEANNIKFEIVK